MKLSEVNTLYESFSKDFIHCLKTNQQDSLLALKERVHSFHDRILIEDIVSDAAPLSVSAIQSGLTSLELLIDEQAKKSLGQVVSKLKQEPLYPIIMLPMQRSDQAEMTSIESVNSAQATKKIQTEALKLLEDQEKKLETSIGNRKVIAGVLLAVGIGGVPTLLLGLMIFTFPPVGIPIAVAGFTMSWLGFSSALITWISGLDDQQEIYGSTPNPDRDWQLPKRHSEYIRKPRIGIKQKKEYLKDQAFINEAENMGLKAASDLIKDDLYVLYELKKHLKVEEELLPMNEKLLEELKKVPTLYSSETRKKIKDRRRIERRPDYIRVLKRKIEALELNLKSSLDK